MEKGYFLPLRGLLPCFALLRVLKGPRSSGSPEEEAPGSHRLVAHVALSPHARTEADQQVDSPPSSPPTH